MERQQRALRKCFYCAYHNGYVAGLARSSKRNPYRDVRALNGRLTGSRGYMRFWAEGNQDGLADLPERYTPE